MYSHYDMNEHVRQVERSDAHRRLVERHQQLLDRHGVLQRKAFDRREHADHKRALSRHLAELAAYRLAARRS
jgi:hypothetical protein